VFYEILENSSRQLPQTSSDNANDWKKLLQKWNLVNLVSQRSKREVLDFEFCTA